MLTDPTDQETINKIVENVEQGISSAKAWVIITVCVLGMLACLVIGIVGTFR